MAFFVIRIDGAPAGCGGVNICEGGCGEIKRLYVRPIFHGMGLARQVMSCRESYAVERCVRSLRLQTGIYQAEAMSLYRRLGYREIPPFGQYREDPYNRFYEKHLC